MCSSGPEYGLHTVHFLGIFAETWLALDGHSSISRVCSQLFHERLKIDFHTLVLGHEAGCGLNLDLHAHVELLIPHVPDALDRGGNRFFPVPTQDGGWLHDPTGHICNLIFEHDSNMPK
jgi:hypothetical protein